MKKLVIGTHNSGKYEELRNLFEQYGFDCLSLKDVGIEQDIEETGKNYKENAILKAKTYAQMSGLLTAAGDSGMSVAALNGEPGIRSRNLKGKKRNTDQELIDYIMEKMENVPANQRSAKLVAAIAICDPAGQCFVEEAYTEGEITNEVDTKRIEGYPFRSLFRLKSPNKMFCHLNDDELKKIAHRAQAIRKLSKYFKQYD